MLVVATTGLHRWRARLVLTRHVADTVQILQKHVDVFRKELVSSGLDVLIKLIKGQPKDNEIIQLTLELLVSLASEGVAVGSGASRADAAADAKSVSSALLSDNQFISTALDFLGSDAVWLRSGTVKLLLALGTSNAEKLCGAILACSVGMGKLVDLLDDPRNEVRSELLLLLNIITESNQEVGTFIVFQDGLDKLFRTIVGELRRSSGVRDGDDATPSGQLEPVALDSLKLVMECLGIAKHVLRSSVTQRLFTQSAGLKQCVAILEVVFRTGADGINEGARSPLVKAAASCARLVMEILDTVLGNNGLAGHSNSSSSSLQPNPPSPLEAAARQLERTRDDAQRHAMQRDIGACPGLIDVVSGIAYGTSPCLDESIRTQAASLLTSIVAGHARNQTHFGGSLVQRSPFSPKAIENKRRQLNASGGKSSNSGANEEPTFDLALTCAVVASLHADDIYFRWASAALVHCYLMSNDAARAPFIAHAFAPPPVALPEYMCAAALENSHVRYSGALERGGAVLSDVVATVAPPGKAVISAVTAAALILGSATGVALSINTALQQLDTLSVAGALLCTALTPAPGSTDSSAQELFLRLSSDRLDSKAAVNQTGSSEPVFNVLSRLFVTAISVEPEPVPPPAPARSSHPLQIPIGVQVGMGLLRVLLACLNGCPASVQAFLSVPSNLAMIDFIASGGKRAHSSSEGADNTNGITRSGSAFLASLNSTDGGGGAATHSAIEDHTGIDETSTDNTTRLYSRGAGAAVLSSCFINAAETADGGAGRGNNGKSASSKNARSGASGSGSVTFTRTSVLQLIQSRVGIGKLTALAQALVDTPVVTAAALGRPKKVVLPEFPSGNGILLVDEAFSTQLSDVIGNTAGAMVGVYSGGNGNASGSRGGAKDGFGADPQLLLQLKEMLKVQDSQMKQMRNELHALRSTHPDAAGAIEAAADRIAAESASSAASEESSQRALDAEQRAVAEESRLAELTAASENEKYALEASKEAAERQLQDFGALYSELERAYHEALNAAQAMQSEVSSLKQNAERQALDAAAASGDTMALELIGEKNSQITTLQAQLNDLQAKANEHASTVQAWEAALAERDAYIQQQAAFVAQLETEKQALQQQAESGDAAAAVGAADQSADQTRIADLEAQLSLYAARVQELAAAGTSNSGHSEGQIMELQAQVLELQTRLSAANASASGDGAAGANDSVLLQQKVAELQHQLQGATESLQQWEAHAASLSEQLRNYEEQYQQLQEHAQALQMQLQSATHDNESEVTAMRSRVADLDARVAQLAAERDVQSSAAAAAKSEKGRAVREVSKLSNELAVSQKARSTLQSAVQTFKSREAAARADVTRLQSEIKALRSELQALKQVADEHEDLLVLLALRDEEKSMLEAALHSKPGGDADLQRIKAFSLQALKELEVQAVASEAGSGESLDLSIRNSTTMRVNASLSNAGVMVPAAAASSAAPAFQQRRQSDAFASAASATSQPPLSTSQLFDTKPPTSFFAPPPPPSHASPVAAEPSRKVSEASTVSVASSAATSIPPISFFGAAPAAPAQASQSSAAQLQQSAPPVAFFNPQSNASSAAPAASTAPSTPPAAAVAAAGPPLAFFNPSSTTSVTEPAPPQTASFWSGSDVQSHAAPPPVSAESQQQVHAWEQPAPSPPQQQQDLRSADQTFQRQPTAQPTEQFSDVPLSDISLQSHEAAPMFQQAAQSENQYFGGTDGSAAPAWMGSNTDSYGHYNANMAGGDAASFFGSAGANATSGNSQPPQHFAADDQSGSATGRGGLTSSAVKLFNAATGNAPVKSLLSSSVFGLAKSAVSKFSSAAATAAEQLAPRSEFESTADNDNAGQEDQQLRALHERMYGRSNDTNPSQDDAASYGQTHFVQHDANAFFGGDGTSQEQQQQGTWFGTSAPEASHLAPPSYDDQPATSFSSPAATSHPHFEQPTVEASDANQDQTVAAPLFDVELTPMGPSASSHANGMSGDSGSSSARGGGGVGFPGFGFGASDGRSNAASVLQAQQANPYAFEMVSPPGLSRGTSNGSAGEHFGGRSDASSNNSGGNGGHTQGGGMVPFWSGSNQQHQQHASVLQPQQLGYSGGGSGPYHVPFGSQPADTIDGAHADQSSYYRSDVHGSDDQQQPTDQATAVPSFPLFRLLSGVVTDVAKAVVSQPLANNIQSVAKDVASLAASRVLQAGAGRSRSNSQHSHPSAAVSSSLGADAGVAHGAGDASSYFGQHSTQHDHQQHNDNFSAGRGNSSLPPSSSTSAAMFFGVSNPPNYHQPQQQQVHQPFTAASTPDGPPAEGELFDESLLPAQQQHTQSQEHAAQLHGDQSQPMWAGASYGNAHQQEQEQAPLLDNRFGSGMQQIEYQHHQQHERQYNPPNHSAETCFGSYDNNSASQRLQADPQSFFGSDAASSTPQSSDQPWMSQPPQYGARGDSDGDGGGGGGLIASGVGSIFGRSFGNVAGSLRSSMTQVKQSVQQQGGGFLSNLATTFLGSEHDEQQQSNASNDPQYHQQQQHDAGRSSSSAGISGVSGQFAAPPTASAMWMGGAGHNDGHNTGYDYANQQQQQRQAQQVEPSFFESAPPPVQSYDRQQPPVSGSITPASSVASTASGTLQFFNPAPSAVDQQQQQQQQSHPVPAVASSFFRSTSAGSSISGRSSAPTSAVATPAFGPTSAPFVAAPPPAASSSVSAPTTTAPWMPAPAPAPGPAASASISDVGSFFGGGGQATVAASSSAAPPPMFAAPALQAGPSVAGDGSSSSIAAPSTFFGTGPPASSAAYSGAGAPAGFSYGAGLAPTLGVVGKHRRGSASHHTQAGSAQAHAHIGTGFGFGSAAPSSTAPSAQPSADVYASPGSFNTTDTSASQWFGAPPSASSMASQPPPQQQPLSSIGHRKASFATELKTASPNTVKGWFG